MIFVTLGSQKFQFNRLLKAIDNLVEDKSIDEQVFAQTGFSEYKPKYYEYEHFLERKEFLSIIEKCDIVITHGGTGAIIGAIKAGKKVIAVPRLVKYGEHVDNHQTQIVSQFRNVGLICACLDVEKLTEALMTVKKTEYGKYESNTQRIIESIDRFLKG